MRNIMASDDDDNGSYARLTELGLLHLRHDPVALKKALDALGQERAQEERAWEKEAAQIRQRHAATTPETPAAPKVVVPPPKASSQPRAPLPAQAEAPAKAKGGLKRKSSTLLILSRTPGRCGDCRHLNHGTTDHREGLYFCQLAQARRAADQACDVKQRFPSDPKDAARPPSSWPEYYFYQAFDGSNSTYQCLEDSRLLLEDAGPEARARAQADRPFIPGE